MANTSLNLVNLDFESLKDSLKTYLQSQTKFRDFDFSGSNINVLLDLLTYNTYLNAFYLNMVGAEMFLDTAQLRDSVVSHAKELNYLPRSFRSAAATINISITPTTNVSSVVIPSQTGFTARVGSNSFNFTTPSSIAITSNTNGIFTASNITIYEGSYVTDTFVKNDALTKERFVLNNPNVDTTSIVISVIEDGGASTLEYVQAFSLFDLNHLSQVFFVQAAENEKYEVIFGDGTFGRRPKDGAVINVTYRISSGELPNGADNFVNNTTIDGHSNVSITLVSSATNGSISETIDSIKFNAPKSFQTQERAVTENDYKTLLTREFPEIEAISVYGGEKVDPPQFGKVYIAIDTTFGDSIPETNKTLYRNYLADKVPLGIETEFVTPLFLFMDVRTIVKYDINSSSLSENQIATLVKQAVATFNSDNLNDFNVEFNFSKFVAAIDNADSSIISNQSIITPFVELVPTLNANTSFNIKLNIPVYDTVTTTSIPNSGIEIHDDAHPVNALHSSSFTFNGVNCILEDDGDGNIRIVQLLASEHAPIKKVGTVDYDNGNIQINDLNVTGYSGSAIRLYFRTRDQDFTSSLNYILAIRSSDVIVTVTPIRK